MVAVVVSGSDEGLTSVHTVSQNELQIQRPVNLSEFRICFTLV